MKDLARILPLERKFARVNIKTLASAGRLTTFRLGKPADARVSNSLLRSRNHAAFQASPIA
jgi:hypothetical protein